MQNASINRLMPLETKLFTYVFRSFHLKNASHAS